MENNIYNRTIEQWYNRLYYQKEIKLKRYNRYMKMTFNDKWTSFIHCLFTNHKAN